MTDSRRKDAPVSAGFRSTLGLFSSASPVTGGRGLCTGCRRRGHDTAAVLDLNPGWGSTVDLPSPPGAPMTRLDVPRYLQRLQLDAPPPRTLAGLTLLQQR
ncbi:arylamine N-acetyltransferase, partial [Stenotrophomonas maltophilia]